MRATAFDRIGRAVETLVSLALLVMVALTFADVIGRHVFNKPIYGAHDLTEHLMAVIVFAGLPVLTLRRGHLTIDLFDARLLRPGLAWWHRLVAVAMAAMLFLIAWRYGLAAQDAWLIKDVSQELLIPRAYIDWFIAAGCALSGLAALMTLRDAGRPRAHGEGETAL